MFMTRTPLRSRRRRCRWSGWGKGRTSPGPPSGSVLAAGCAAGGEFVDLVVGDPAGAEPHREPGDGVDDEPDPGVRLVAGDLIGQRAAVPGAVAEGHVDVGGGGDAEADAGGEQLPDVDDVLGRFLDVADDAVSGGAALGQDLREQRAGLRGRRSGRRRR